jgi:glycine dehydrogenase subunit 1
MTQNQFEHPYIPNTLPKIRSKMMKEVGIKDVMELYKMIPDKLLLKRDMDLPEPIRDELSIKRHIEDILNENKTAKECLNFLGAGCAQHYVPAVCDEIVNRGEFLTSYGAQGWADHGRHQALFEYNSLMAELLEMDILSNPVYDGGQAVCTSLCMASRMTGRKKVLLPGTINYETLVTAKNYLRSLGKNSGIIIELIKYDPKTLLMDMDDLKSKLNNDIAAVLIENPTYLGIFESQAEDIGKLARKAGAEFIVSVDPITLGVVASPASYGATIACGDFHSLGLHLLYGGAQGGFIATPDDIKYISEFKDLMYGLNNTIVEGEYGFATIMAKRTSYGVREKGKEFTGTSTNLWAINAVVYLALMGPQGMDEVGRTIMKTAQYAAKMMSKIKGVKLLSGQPFFKEFVVNFDKTNKTVKQINKKLLDYNIFGGKDISPEFHGLGQNALYCVTEIFTKGDIDKLVYALNAVIND